MQGIKCALYLDDGIIDSDSLEICNINTKIALSDLERSGFLLNESKSNLIPTQTGEWLGTIFDTSSMSFSVPQRKIITLKDLLSQSLNNHFITPKLLSKIARQLSSMHLSLGPAVRLFTRGIYYFIEQRQSWYEKLLLDDNTKTELRFWYNNIDSKNGYHLKPQQTTSQILFTDASDKSYGGFVLQRLGKRICFGSFTSLESGTSSTARELLAIKYSLSSFCKFLIHQAVNIRTDNLSASRILEIGSSKPWLQSIAVDIFDICVKNDIKLKSTWIPREQNKEADFYSKMVDTDDWTIDNVTFQKICLELGKVTIDRFSNNLNCKVSIFNSKYYCPKSSGRDAFTFDWSKTLLNWLCPPIGLINSTINHLKLCKAKGILIIPEWPSSYFWPLLFQKDSKQSFIKKVLYVNPYYTSNSSNCIFQGLVSFRTLALLIDCSEL